MPHKIYQCCDSNNCNCGDYEQIYVSSTYKVIPSYSDRKCDLVREINKRILAKDFRISESLLIKLRTSLFEERLNIESLAFKNGCILLKRLDLLEGFNG